MIERIIYIYIVNNNSILRKFEYVDENGLTCERLPWDIQDDKEAYLSHCSLYTFTRERQCGKVEKEKIMAILGSKI